ncbi:MAG: diguanylate cyclase with sensor [Sporomusa sp.]|nr:diguanylate cyclase with sensor [Sporomusa sp.]
MQKLGFAFKYINYLVIAALLLPIIFIAEVVYVERQYATSDRQVQTQELAKLKTAAAAEWLDSQAAYLRGIAGLHSVQTGNREILADEFRSLLAAGTGFLSLEYTGMDGESQVNIGEPYSRNVGDRAYFIAAAAGRQFIGELPGTEWRLTDPVTVVAVPVIVNGEIMGVVYGVIPKETIEAVTAKLVTGVASSELVPTRWYAWLGLVYLLGVIPLVLIVYIVRRHSETISLKPEQGSQKSNRMGDRKLGDKMPPVIVDRTLAAAAATAYKAIKTAVEPESAAVTNDKSDEILDTVFDKEISEPLPAPPIQDDLTGLSMQTEFEKALVAANGKEDIGIIVCSVDGMKVINDFLGRRIGDSIIKAAADSIKSAIGPKQTAARLDGDKFAVLITNATTSLLEDCKKDIRYYVDLHNLQHPELPLSMTVGCAAAEQGQDLQAVLHMADSNMVSHKSVSRVQARKFIMWSIRRHRRRT